ncbi:MAG: exodeoxyribonuclease beta subunit, partial [Frankiales bacterium]|nr:exodeoxyribonuclease beta subunit [Frankiales bacterium]
ATGGGTRERWPRGHAPDGRRTLFVGGSDHPGHRAACSELDAEDAGEELRLLYVAVTRAVSELVLWWCPSTKTEGGPLHRLLFCDDPSRVPQTVKVPDDAKALAHLRALGLVVEPVHERERLTWSGEAPEAGELVLAQFTRGLDLSWRRTSYTGLTRAAHDAPHVGSEPEASAKDDDADTETVVTDEGDVAWKAVPSPMADLAGGTTFGTLVHAVLEEADLSSLAGLTAAAEVQLRRRGGPCSAVELAEALLPSVSASLGPLADSLALRDIPRPDLLAELDFELPLSGGDVPGPVVTLGQVAALLRRHLTASDPVAPYADMLDVPGLSGQVLRGYLGGSIDAVVRIGGRYLVVDHKTNRLGPYDEPLTAWHYRRASLDDAVRRAHYPLQALLYDVALHRYLRWRQPGYDPSVHLGGVLYLFLRGMTPDAAGAGVWDWKPPSSLVVELSDLLAGRA